MINYFVNNFRIATLLTIVIVISGILNLISMKREAFPNVNFAQATITTYYPGATPEDVEVLITKKIEDALRGNSGIKQLTSVSQEGFSEVKIKVDLDNVDAVQEMTEIQREVDRISDLPNDLPEAPKFTEIKTEQMPILEISVLGDVDYDRLRDIADDLEDSIEITEGVSGINKIGYLQKELKLLLEPDKMASQHVSFDEVIRSIGEHNVNMPGGILESIPLEKSVRIESKLEKPTLLNNVIIRTNLSNKIIKASDIGKARLAYEKPKVITKTNGKPSIILVVKKDKHADIIQLCDSIKDKIAKLQENISSEVDILISNDESERTSNRLDIVSNNSMLGFVLLFLATIVFLNLRTSIVTSMSVPIIILFTLTLMSWLNITFNIISMLAIIIALGMFVDNSIVISENIYRLSQAGMPVRDAAVQGTKEIAAPIVATVLTTIAAFMPMSVTSGILGEFIWAIPVIVSGSLLISLFESFCLLPSRIIRMHSNYVEREIGWFTKLQNWFVIKLTLILKYRYRSLMSAILLLFTVLAFAFTKMDFVLFPPEGVDRFIVRYSAPVGTSIHKLHKAVSEIEEYIMKFPEEEVIAVTTRTGVQQKDPSDPLARTGDNLGMMIVYLTNENKRQRTADEIIEDLRNKFPIFTPLDSLTFETIVNGPPVGKPVTINLKGSNLDTLKEVAKEVKGYLASIDGVQDIDQDLKPGLKQLQIKMRDNIGENYGLTPRDVARALRSALEGIVAAKVRQFDEDIDIRVMFSDESRSRISSLRSILVANKKGDLIPLHQVADIVEMDGPEARRHYNHQRSITVTSGVDLKRITSSEVNAKIIKKFGDLSTRYPGYSIKLGGEEESSQESMASLGNAMVLALLGIFTILVAILRSYWKPFLIMFSIPFSFIGPIVGFAIHGKPFGFIAMIGLIGLLGVVINAAIILVAVVDNMREKTSLSMTECLVQGASIRLRPIMLTTLTTILALFPTAYGVGGYDPVLVPMTLAMSWGLLFGTFLTLIVVPCGYAVIEDLISRLNQSKQKS